MTLFRFNYYGLTANKFSTDIVQTSSKSLTVLSHPGLKLFEKLAFLKIIIIKKFTTSLIIVAPKQSPVMEKANMMLLSKEATGKDSSLKNSDDCNNCKSK